MSGGAAALTLRESLNVRDLSDTKLSTEGRRCRSSLAVDHRGHGCCLDADRATGQGPHALLGVGRRLDRETGALSPDGRALVFPLRCGTWVCFCCAVVLRARARRRVFKGVSVGGRVFMVGLTIDPADARWIARRDELVRQWEQLRAPGYVYRAGPGRPAGFCGRYEAAVTRASVRYVAECWNRMATSMRRDPELRDLLDAGAGGRAVIPYHKSMELQANGRAHLHVIIRVPSLAHGFRHRKRLRDLAVAAGFGGDAARGRGMGFDMQAARSRAELSAYVTKGVGLAGYTTKAADLVPRYARRFSWARSWCEWTPATRIAGLWDWRVAGGSAELVTRTLEASGFHVVDPASCRIYTAGGGGPAPSAGGA